MYFSRGGVRTAPFDLSSYMYAIVLQIEEMYKKAHANIRADPEAKPAPAKKEYPKKRYVGGCSFTKRDSCG